MWKYETRPVIPVPPIIKKEEYTWQFDWTGNLIMPSGDKKLSHETAECAKCRIVNPPTE